MFIFFVSSCSSFNLSTVLDITSLNPYEKQDDAFSIQNIWSIDIGNKRDYKTGVLQPVFMNNNAYTIDSQGFVSAINLLDGNVLWTASLDMEVSSGLSIHNKKIFFGTNDGMFYGYDIETLVNSYSFIDTLDFIDFLDNTALVPIMSTQLKSEASSPAIGIDDLIFIKLDDGDTTAINIEDNNLEWNYKGRNVPLSIKGSGAIGHQYNNIYVPRDDGNIISLVASSGKLNWLASISPRSGRNELESLRDVEISPVISDGVLFIGSYQGNLISIDILNGNIIWSRPMSVMSHFSVDDSSLYISDDAGYIYSIDRYNGDIQWKQKIPNNTQSTQTFIMNNYILSLSVEGHVIVIDKIDGKLLVFERVLNDIDVQINGLLQDKTLYIVSKNGRLNAIKIN
ncbi:MAG: PQQ-binding-like beta-propeller repeat protein [Gammaproteobacteria bacterium]